MENLSLTVGIVSSFVENNRIAAEELPALIATVHRALSSVNAPEAEVAEAPIPKLTSAQVRRSIRPESLISFEDGKPYRMLKRHLNTMGLTPEAYRAKWGLPLDYPMVAPEYSERRSEFAKSIGLGNKRRGARRANR